MKRVRKMCLALALMVAAVFAVSMSSSAAGTHTVSGTYKINGTDVDVKGTSFKLYKVGTFGRNADGTVKLVLLDDIAAAIAEDPDMSEFDLNDITKPESEDEGDIAQWREAWFAKAKKLAVYLDNAELVGEAVSDENGAFSFTGISEDLYLLVSDSNPKIVENDDDTNTAWSPQPMLVVVLNGDVELTVKPIATPVVENYVVNKQWLDEDGKEYKDHPDSISINIYYNYIPLGENTPVNDEPIVLNDDNDWTHKWSSSDYGDKIRYPYTVKEVISDEMKKDYTFEPKDKTSEAADTQTTIIKNIHHDPTTLKIKKTRDSSVDFLGGKSVISTAFAFEITGYYDDEQVYHTFAGIDMEYDEFEKEITVSKELPGKINRLVVKEIYAAGYTPTPDTVELTKDHLVDGVYTASFENQYNTPVYSGGVINRFSLKDGKAGVPEQVGLFYKPE